MKKLMITIFCIAISLCGCGDRKEMIRLIDSPPEITISKLNPTLGKEVITDSVRFYENPSFFYNTKLLLSDKYKNIWKLNYNVSKGNAKVYYDGKDLNLTSIRVDLDEILLSVSPRSKGNISVDFIVEDRFSNTKQATLNLFVFDNLIPIAVVSAKKFEQNSPLEYTIDANASYDQDANFNGAVVGYIFNIEGKSIQTTNPTINYIFPTQGTYNIELKVIDNNGAISNPTIYKLNVN